MDGEYIRMRVARKFIRADGFVHRDVESLVESAFHKFAVEQRACGDTERIGNFLAEELKTWVSFGQYGAVHEAVERAFFEVVVV